MGWFRNSSRELARVRISKVSEREGGGLRVEFNDGSALQCNLAFLDDRRTLEGWLVASLGAALSDCPAQPPRDHADETWQTWIRELLLRHGVALDPPSPRPASAWRRLLARLGLARLPQASPGVPAGRT